MTKRKGFSAEFKREAVRLLETSQKPPQISPADWEYGAISSTSGKSR
jgi:transposase-like protein